MSLDYCAMIYAAIVATPWRHANVQEIQYELRRKHGVLGHLSVQEFRADAIVLAQRQIEGEPARSHGPACNYCDDSGTIVDGAGDRYRCDNCR